MSHRSDRLVGRLHVTIPRYAQNGGKAVASERLLAAFDGITKVTFNAADGRMTVHYDKDMIGVDHILLLLSSMGLTRRKRAAAPQRPRGAAVPLTLAPCIGAAAQHDT
jgi:hypothetical protein